MVNLIEFPFLHVVCFSVVEKFANGLTSDEKKDAKKIEEKFRTFCKTSKGKEHRFVSIIKLVH